MPTKITTDDCKERWPYARVRTAPLSGRNVARRKLASVLAIVSIVLPAFDGPFTAQAQTDFQDQASLQAEVSERFREIHEEPNTNFPGGSFAMVLPSGDVITACVGVSSRETAVPLTPEGKMMSASIGKTYFAAMAMDLVANRQMAIDDSVGKYLGSEPWFDRLPNAEDLQIKHLMRHQSGLPRYVLVRQLWTDVMADPDRQWTPGDQLAYIYDRPALHPAGQGWAYSDSNYILLGLIMQQITGSGVYAYVDERFLTPHRLTETVPNNQREIEGLIQGYTNIFQAFGLPEKVIEDGKFVFNPAMEWCGGGYACTARDLARWAKVYFSGQALENDYVSLLQDEAVDASALLGTGAQYGLGVIIRDTELGTMLGHDGGFPGYTSTMGYLPEHEIAAALMINTDGGKALGRASHQVMMELISVALGD